jgi:hypothetical protein
VEGGLFEFQVYFKGDFPTSVRSAKNAKDLDMFDWRRMVKGSVPFLALFVCGGCNLVSESPGPWTPLYSVAGFTALSDTLLALRLNLREERGIAPNRTETRGRRSLFVLIDRYRSEIHPVGETLPASAGPGLPAYFLACRDGTPVSLSPGGPKGSGGDCSAEKVAASARGGLAVFSLDSGAYKVLDADLKPLFRIPGPRLGTNSILAADDDSGFVTVLTHSSGNGGYWRRYPADSSVTADSAYLTWPTVVRIAGYGARIVCSEIDEAYGYSACWRARNELGFADAARRYCAMDCEWNPASGLLVSTTNFNGRFLFVRPHTGSEETFDTIYMLDSLAKAEFPH